MDRLQNRVAFGDDVLGRLGEAPEAVKEEASAFEERHAALRSAASEASSPQAEHEPPTAVIEAWDAALRRLIDRLRAETPSKVGDILAPKHAGEAPKPTPKTSGARRPERKPPQKRKPKTKATPTPVREPAREPVTEPRTEPKPTPKPERPTRAKPKRSSKKDASIKRRRGR